MIERLTGKNRKKYIEEGRCMICDDDALEFNDAISFKEYSISGYCQTCQDIIFESTRANQIKKNYKKENLSPTIVGILWS